MKISLFVIVGLSAVLYAAASCPNQCSGHGRCHDVDLCECYRQAGTNTPQRYLYTGADCSQRTCPVGIAFDQIATLRNRLSSVLFEPATEDGGTTSELRVFLDRDYTPSLNQVYMVRVASASALEYQWKLGTEPYFGQPIAMPLSRFDAHELGNSSGVRVWFDDVNSIGDNDIYTFSANHNDGIDWDESNDNSAHQLVECSGRGRCNSETGQCECFDGYTGEACQRTTCPNGCSGHGVCQEIRRFASDADKTYRRAFDARKEMGCMCDPGFRGPDCSMIECPSGPDPLGGAGGLEGRDCSNRGICDYSTGICKCFKGYFGERCESQTHFV